MCTILTDREEIIKIVEAFFETGKTKDLSVLKDIQSNSADFSSFSDVPPFDLKDFATSIALEELRFVSISDYDYEIIKPKISIFDNSAVVAFELIQKGMLVDNKAFTGEHISINGRGTFVLIKNDTWKIIHIHLSKIKNS
ncbi:MAG: hypothetical protein VX539_03365 [Thermoproteota archaeon]|nr:hypothetical protein [Thermoproteota archaeon]